MKAWSTCTLKKGRGPLSIRNLCGMGPYGGGGRGNHFWDDISIIACERMVCDQSVPNSKSPLYICSQTTSFHSQVPIEKELRKTAYPSSTLHTSFVSHLPFPLWSSQMESFFISPSPPPLQRVTHDWLSIMRTQVLHTLISWQTHI